MNVMKVMNVMKANLVGMARMPYSPTICKDNSELLLIASTYIVKAKIQQSFVS